MSELNPLMKHFRQARQCSVPLIAINTVDPADTMNQIIWALVSPKTMSESTSGAQDPIDLVDAPILKWDLGHGLSPMNKKGQQVHGEILGQAKQPATMVPAEALRMLERVPQKTLVFWLGAHRTIHHDAIAQGVWNLRENYKSKGASFVLLGTGIKIPADLQHDVIALDEPLPNDTQLRTIVQQIYTQANVDQPSEDTLSRAVEAVEGLSAFCAEQVTALAMTPQGVRLDDLWERKRQMIDQTPGLSINREHTTFNDIRGNKGLKSFSLKLKQPRSIVVLDELEKILSGATSGGSGQSDLSQQMLGTLLSYLQDHRCNGLLLTGIQGTSKSMFAKTLGNEMGKPTITFRFNEVRGGLVGETERQLRHALNIISAVSHDDALFIGTTNSVSSLPPELIRRFTYGTWFFDLPTAEERIAIWDLYRQKYGLDPADTLPDDENWTGDEIARCSKLSHDTRMSLQEASSYIIPFAKSNAESLAQQRDRANGRYLSANTGLVYHTATIATPSSTRAFRSI